MKWYMPTSIFAIGIITACSEHPSKIGVTKEESPQAQVAASPPARADRSAPDIYNATCNTCHGPDGMGDENSGYPPLAGSKWLNGNSEVPIRILLNGISGPIEVNGKQYNSAMTAQAPMFFSDSEFASVLTYARSQWGNQGTAVSAAEVAAVKAQHAGKGPEKAADLEKLLGAASAPSPAEGAAPSPAEGAAPSPAEGAAPAAAGTEGSEAAPQ